MKQYGIIPVVVLNDIENAIPVAKALLEGGAPCIEVTFRTEAAEESIQKIASAYPEMLIGAGMVLAVEQVNRAVAEGAKFIESPGFDLEVVDYCCEKGIPISPGIVHRHY